MDILLQSTYSHISLSLDKSNFIAAANNFTGNVSDNEEYSDGRDL